VDTCMVFSIKYWRHIFTCSSCALLYTCIKPCSFSGPEKYYRMQHILIFFFKCDCCLYIIFSQGNLCCNRIPATSWPFSSHLVNIIKEHRVLILEYFGSSEKHEGWNASNKMAAIGYKTFLKKFQTVFIFKLLSSVLAHSEILFHTLQTKCLDMVFVPI
jgi:hypothetical protein